MNEVLVEQSLPKDQLASVNAAKKALAEKIHDKINEATSIERIDRRKRFSDAADAAVLKHAPKLKALKIPPAVLDGMICLEAPGEPPSKFVVLRQWLALLLDQGRWTIDGLAYNNGYAVTLKQPGERTMTIIFNFDAGDLFIDAIGKGSSIERVISPVDKSLVANFMKQLVSYQD